MKKLIAILAIAIVLVGAVFAAENHTIRVFSEVGEKVPAFRMDFANAVTNADSTKWATNGSYLTYATNANAQDVSFDISNITDVNGDGVYTAAFAVYLVKNSDGYNAKSTNTYKLTFSDGQFKDVKRSGVAGVLDPTNISVAKNNDAIETEAENGPRGITSITPGADSATSVLTPVVFSGKTVNSDELLLVTATYSWTPDQTIDIGKYYADIKLEITKE